MSTLKVNTLEHNNPATPVNFTVAPTIAGVALANPNGAAITPTNVTASGNLTVDGNTTLGNAAGDLITFNAAAWSAPNGFAIGTDKLVLSSTFNLGLGIAPSAWGGAFKAFQVGSNAALWGSLTGAGATFLSNNTYFDGTNFKALNTGAASYIALDTSGDVLFVTAPSVTSGSNQTITQAMTLKRVGNLLVGPTSDNGEKLQISGIPSGAANSIARFRGTTTSKILLIDDANNSAVGTDGAGSLVFYTNDANTEVSRFNPLRYFKASSTGMYGGVAGLGDLSADTNHLFQGDSVGSVVVSLTGNTAPTVNTYLSALATGAAGNHFNALLNTNIVYQVLANGNVQNSNNSFGAISDSRLKNVIGNAPSYWDKYKLIQWVKYTLKSDDTNQEMLGVIAQQTREVFPGLIQETPDMVDVVKTREVTKTVPVTRTETQETTRTEIQLVNGKYTEVVITESKDVQVPVVDEFPIYDSEGKETGRVHKVPRTETITETEEYTEKEPNGEVTLSVKYSILGHIADVVLQEAMARIEALEA